MVDELPSGERGKVGHSQVDAHIVIARGQGFGLADLAGTYCVPVLALSLDRERFDRACHIPVQMQFHRADLRQFEIDPDDALFVCWPFLCIQFPACSIRIGKRVIAVASLEAL